jgi:hypothetical protein
MKRNALYTQFPPGEEPIARTFRMSKADWERLLKIRDQLLTSQGIKLSLNAVLIHLLHLQEKAQEAKS